MDDDGRHDQPGGLLTASNVSVTGTVTAGYPLAGGGTVSGSTR